MTGNKKLDLIVGAVNLVLILIALGLFAFSIFQKKPLPKDEEELELLKKDARSRIFHDTFAMETQLINLPGKNAKLRYLEVEANLHPFKREQIDLLKESTAILNDVLIDQASRMDPDELNSTVGRILLEDRIKKEVNAKLKSDIVKRIFFSKFTVQ